MEMPEWEREYCDWCSAGGLAKAIEEEPYDAHEPAVYNAGWIAGQRSMRAALEKALDELPDGIYKVKREADGKQKDT